MQEKAVDKIREFNRFYLPEFDLLGNRYLGSQYSAAEARTLFEIYMHDGCSAASIAKTMRLDKSYMSRIIRSHENSGYLIRTVSAADNRSYELHLTESGISAVKTFIARSNDQVGARIQHLTDADCRRLIAALDTIIEILGETHYENHTLRSKV